MAAILATGFGDLVAGTLRELGRMKFSQIAQTTQRYICFSQWFKKEKVVLDEGVGIQRNLMTRLQGAARHVGLMDGDNVNLADHMSQLQVDWRHVQTSWTVGYREALMNRGKALVFNVIIPRRTGAMIDLAAEIETRAWASPGASDTTLPNGLPYYVVKNATTGFTGGAPSGHTLVANINPTTVTAWKNYSCPYVSVSKLDLLPSMRTAARKIDFQSPVDTPEYAGSPRQHIYVNETTMGQFEMLGENQNENLGRDIASMDGKIVFHGNPIIWVSTLDSDTSNPVYMIDHETFYPVCLKGDYLRESKNQAPNQHDWEQYFVDLTYNFLCVNRRRNAVLYIA